MALVLLNPPAALNAARYTLRLLDTVTEPRGVYGFSEARLDWGGECWAMTLETPPLSAGDEAEILAWCDALRMPNRAARLTPSGWVRRGTTTAASLAITASVSAGARSVPVSGVGAGETLLAGSPCSVKGRLHRIRESVTGDAATLELTPRLRVAVTASDNVVLSGSGLRGQWRLQSSPESGRDYGQIGANARGLALEFVEAFG